MYVDHPSVPDNRISDIGGRSRIVGPDCLRVNWVPVADSVGGGRRLRMDLGKEVYGLLRSCPHGHQGRFGDHPGLLGDWPPHGVGGVAGSHRSATELAALL